MHFLKFVIRPSVLLAALAALIASGSAAGQQAGAARRERRVTSSARSEEVYLFAYFVGDSQDGLHLAYSNDGLIWHALNNGHSLLRPQIGGDKLMRDPHIALGPDNVFHMVWTAAGGEPVIGYAESEDLIHWSEQRGITPFKNEPDARNIWAPESFYDGDTQQYLLFWATTMARPPGSQHRGELDHRIYLTTTKDFLSFTPTRLFFNRGFSVIDATIVKDGQRYVMFLKDESGQPVTGKTILYAVSDRATGPYRQASAPITSGYWAEGPSAIKIGERWIVYFDKYTVGRYGAVASTDLKHWEDISRQLQFVEGARHGTVLRVSQAVLTKLLELK